MDIISENNLFYLSDKMILRAGDLVLEESLDTFDMYQEIVKNHKAILKKGYTVIDLLSQVEIDGLREELTQIISHDLGKYQPVPEDFSLDMYHKFLLSEETHYEIATWGIHHNQLIKYYDVVKMAVEKVLNVELDIKEINHRGVLGKYIGYRIVRPHKDDHNPFHRDSWISYWRDTVNVWIPICGFSAQNGLQLIEESHSWPNNEIFKTSSGYVLNDKVYHVPAAIAVKRPFDLIKPILQKGQGILFTPYLLHGNGINTSTNETRVSVEFRFCLKNS